MLHAIAQLPEYRIGNVRRVLRNEINTDGLRANQADNLLDFIQQHLRRIVKQQMRFIKEKDQLWLLLVAGLRQPFVKL